MTFRGNCKCWVHHRIRGREPYDVTENLGLGVASYVRTETEYSITDLFDSIYQNVASEIWEVRGG